jgi:dienelactone hydrolase
MTTHLPAVRLALAVAMLVFASGSAALAQAGAVAWKAAKIYVPAALATSGADCESDIAGKCASGIKPGKHPVILFLHGCGGPRSPRTFLGLGAIVVAPNSFADGSGCKADAAYMVKLVGVRHGDVAFAASQLKAAPWADPARLVLAGYSNGAQTTATYPGDEFKARIIVAWTCNNPRVAAQNGVKGNGPALALLGTADEFYKKVGITGDCNAALAKREGSRSILIKGGSHEILDHAETRAAVAAFVPGVIK